MWTDSVEIWQVRDVLCIVPTVRGKVRENGEGQGKVKEL